METRRRISGRPGFAREYPRYYAQQLIHLILDILYRIRYGRSRQTYDWIRRESSRIPPRERESLIWDDIDHSPPKTSFNPALHPILPTLQKSAVEDLWRFFGLEWIPAQYWELLVVQPDPTHAFRRFCANFGLPTQSVRFQNATAIEMLHQCVGILLELGEMRDTLLEQDHERVVRAMRERDYARAEDLVMTLHIVITVLNESLELLKEIEIAEYRLFISEVAAQQKVGFSTLERSEAETILKDHEDYKLLWHELKALLGSIDELVGWLEANWPDNDWGEANLAVVHGIADAYDDLVSAIKTDHDTNPFDAMGRFRQIKEDFMGLVAEVAKAAGEEWYDTPYEGTLEERLRAWHRALHVLGFPEDANPTEVELKKAKRNEQFEHHPDRHQDDPPDVQEMHRQAFEWAGQAFNTLIKGRPTAD